MARDAFGARGSLETGQGPVTIFRLSALHKAGVAPGLERLPFSIKILLESVLRSVDGELVTEDDVRKLARWGADVATRGRPICPQCGQPMEPEGPFCPKKNGHLH